MTADLPADVPLMHVVQQHIHHQQLAPQGCNVQWGLPCRVALQDICPSSQQQLGTACMARLTGQEQWCGPDLVTCIQPTAQL